MERRAREFLVPVLAGALLLCAPEARGAGGSTGVEGVAAYRGDFVSGAVVLAFRDPGPGPGAVPLAVSEGTDGSGRYRLELSPGSYYLAAVKTEGEPWPVDWAPEDLFCYYLGNPIVVAEGKMTRVGFNMVRFHSRQEPVAGERSGIEGRTVFEDAPLGRAYVYVYRDGSTNFRGMGLAAVPSDGEGRFRIRLAPGSYYVLSRKRQAGGMYGPPAKDDHIGYYPGNPVEVREGEATRIVLENTTRVDILEETWFTEGESAGWLRGAVTDRGGEPVPGLYVFFHLQKEMTGSPAFVAGPTDGEGKFKVRSARGDYYITARSGLGGPLEEGEWYGLHKSAAAGEAFSGDSETDIRITVDRYGGD